MSVEDRRKAVAEVAGEGESTRIKGAQQFGRTWLIPAGFKWKALPRGPKPK
jgi:hypothetical protein